MKSIFITFILLVTVSKFNCQNQPGSYTKCIRLFENQGCHAACQQLDCVNGLSSPQRCKEVCENYTEDQEKKMMKKQAKSRKAKS